MKYYQFSLWKDPEIKTDEIIEKESAVVPVVDLTNRKVSILQWYDQKRGPILVFLAGEKEILQAFQDGLQLGMKKEELL